MNKKLTECISINIFKEDLARVENNGKYGFADTNFDIVIPIKYDYAFDFNEGLALVCHSQKWGFINKKGEEIVPIIYEHADSFSKGIAPVCLDEDWIFIDKEGAALVSFGSQYSYIAHESDGLFLVENSETRLCGYINQSGTLIIDCIYDNATPFSEGIASVAKNEKYGYIDTKGDVVIPIIFSEANDFNNGFAIVFDENDKKLIIDKQGSVSEQFSIYTSVSDFLNGFSSAKIDDKYGIIDNQGSTIIPIMYDSEIYEHNKYFSVELDNKFGIVDIHNNIIIPIEYYTAKPLGNNYFFVEYDKNNGAIFDKKGNIIQPLIITENAYLQKLKKRFRIGKILLIILAAALFYLIVR